MSRIVRFAAFLVAAVIAASAAVYAIGDFHRIEYTKGDIIDCPKFARKGASVTVKTAPVTDGYLELFVDGVEVKPEQEGVFTFVMPDHSVRVTSRIAGFDFGGTKTGKTGDIKMEETGKKAVKVIYDRMWIYGLRAETEDQETVDLVASIIDSMALSTEATNYGIEDFTDRVTLVYEDGTSRTYVFDGGYYYSPDDKMHYQVLSGRNELSTVLDYIVKASQ